MKQVDHSFKQHVWLIVLTGCLVFTACHRKKIDYSSYYADEAEQNDTTEDDESNADYYNQAFTKKSPKISLKNRNKPHTIATDFKYFLKDGSVGRLSSLNNQLLLLFYDDSNSDYRDIPDQITLSATLSERINQGKVRVLTVYTGAKESDYINYSQAFPATWINAWEPSGNLKKHELYDIRHLPSLYLIDRNNVILLKQTDIESIENFLYSN